MLVGKWGGEPQVASNAIRSIRCREGPRGLGPERPFASSAGRVDPPSRWCASLLTCVGDSATGRASDSRQLGFVVDAREWHRLVELDLEHLLGMKIPLAGGERLDQLKLPLNLPMLTFRRNCPRRWVSR